jgi:hypothetical protein
VLPAFVATDEEHNTETFVKLKPVFDSKEIEAFQVDMTGNTEFLHGGTRIECHN